MSEPAGPGGSKDQAPTERSGLLLAVLVVVLALGLGVVVGRVTGPVQDESPAGVFQRVASTVVSVTVEAPAGRVGSGFAVGPDQVVTARHTVVDAKEISVKTMDGTVYPAKVKATDSRTDLALLEVSGARFEVAPMGPSKALRIGDTVLAIGNPYGLSHTLSVGVVGSVGRRIERGVAGPEVDFLQLSMPLHPGNSGGPIFDVQGRVVGVLAGTHAQGQSIGFAVPTEAVDESLLKMRRGESVGRAFLGVRATKVDGKVVVERVIASGPADQAGIRPGDQLVSVGTQALTVPEDLDQVLDALGGGEIVEMVLVREGQWTPVQVQLADWAEQPVVTAGMTLRPQPGTGGVVVSVRERSRAAVAGMLEGDAVRTVNGVPVQAPVAVKDLLQAAEPAMIEVLRDGASVTVQLDAGGS
jgi:serine protease Do